MRLALAASILVGSMGMAEAQLAGPCDGTAALVLRDAGEARRSEGFRDFALQVENVVKQAVGAQPHAAALRFGPLLAAAMPTPEIGTPLLESPWLRVGRPGVSGCDLQIEILWDERQILMDQASLASGRPVPRGPELTQDSWRQQIDAYEEAALRAPSPAAQQQGQQALEARMPPELLWLLRAGWQSTRGPFAGSVAGTLQRVSKRAAAPYAQLVATLLQKALAQPDRPQRYANILELGAIMDLAAYRIADGR
jgi:hypothetical protein